ncbi:MAG: hypothetical protein LBE35_03885 [Clostridiales bacterium]|nr:hypothetical protein [Clostridiales bacterium]
MNHERHEKHENAIVQTVIAGLTRNPLPFAAPANGRGFPLIKGMTGWARATEGGRPYAGITFNHLV